MKKIFLVVKEGAWETELLSYLTMHFSIVEEAGQAEIILVIGGDGTMLHSIQKYRDLGLPFVGLHKGGPTSVGFIMDDICLRVLDELSLDKISFIESRLLMARLFDGPRIKTVYGFTDVNFERAGTQALKINISINGVPYFQPIQCDGILVASAMGSTAYSANAGGVILYPDSTDFVLTAVAPQICFGWNTAVLPAKEKVLLELVEAEKRPGRFVVDGVAQGCEFTRAEIGLSDKTVRVGFADGTDYRKKVRDLQFRGRMGR